MGEEELHYPGQVEADTEAEEEAPAAEETTKETPEEKPDGESKKEEELSDDDKEKDDQPSEPVKKKRSIYDDLKDEKKQRREAQHELETAHARIAELEGLLTAKADATTPKEKADAEDDIAAFYERLKKEEGLTPDGIADLTKIIEKRIAKSDGLSEEDRALLAEVKAEKAARARAAEDAETRKAAPFVKKELGIQDEAELEKVMDEVIRLSHTEEFHDKEPEYILWKNREKLSKMVSPKKPSFESGDTRQESEDADELDYSGSMTPEQLSGVIHQTRERAPNLSIKKARK